MKFDWKHVLCGCVVLWTTGCGGDDAAKTEDPANAQAYTLPPPAAGEGALGPGGGPDGAPGGGGGPGGGGPGGPGGGGPPPAPPATPVTIENGTVALTPETTRIVFVGTHSDPNRPDPRTGGFEKFTGKATVADGKVTAVEVEIDANSIFTFQDGLTTHLKTADFFEVNEFPDAKFVSTKIEGEGADTTVTGDLTLHGVTKSVTFPAKVNITDSGLTLESEFKINRFDFEMNGVKDRVLPDVDLRIAIGRATKKEEILAAGGGAGGGRGGRGGRGGGRGGFDPMQMFASQDANNDGKLSGDEISERMRNFLDRIDTDGNGEVSKEEMQAMADRMGGQGGGGRPGGGGSGRPARPGQ